MEDEYEMFTVYKYKGGKIRKSTEDMILNVFLSGFSPKNFKRMSSMEKISIIRGIREYINDNQKTWYCVYSEFGKIISIIGVTETILKNRKGQRNPSFQLELQAISTIPAYRGKGFVKHLIEEICKNEKSGLWLEVNEKNPAFKVYTKIGFQIYEEIEPKYEDDIVYEEGSGGKRYKMILRC